MVDHLERDVLKSVFLAQKKSVQVAAMFIHQKCVSEIYTQMLRPQSS